MSDFMVLKHAVQEQFEIIKGGVLFRTNVDKDKLWDTYLGSFKPEDNPIFRERTEHDCQCCKQFIRAAGGMVAINDDYELVSIWDINIGGPYQVVADALSELVKSEYIKDSFLHETKHLGTDFNHQSLDNGDILKWEHFYLMLPEKFVNKTDIDPTLGNIRTTKEVFKRGLSEISHYAIETVIELIDQGSVYRGEEFKQKVEDFLYCKKEFDLIGGQQQRDNYCWLVSKVKGNTARIRNTAIGTLLVDISNDVELDRAVFSFNNKMDPTNYKRPSAVITQGMIAKAQTKVMELGISDSLARRHAVASDLTINNVLFANRDSKKAMDVFDELSEAAPSKVGDLSKVDEVSIEGFVENILPKAENIEILVENNHINNFMSLIAPEHAHARPLFPWDNGFSWSYKGEVADSIKDRVKKAGGNVEGVLRCSLSWFNKDDLDIHCTEPKGNHIFFRNKYNVGTLGTLDVDMNASGRLTRDAVENITWSNKNRMQEGIYEILVNQYTRRENVDFGFDVEIEYDGIIHSFHYDSKVVGNVTVAKFRFSKENGIKFISSLPEIKTTKEVWGINTGKFQKVSLITISPNHWDGKLLGNKHWFFILDGCKNDEKTRGFYNEFLRGDLTEHRKVFEVLGSKMRVAESDDQLSGLGFSSTRRTHIYARVTGSFTRTIKINF